MIKITNYHKKFNAGTINEVYALQNINLEIKEGEFVTVIGTNGSGKSTLLNAIAGSFYPDEGEIYIDNKNVTYRKDFERARSIARVFQNPFSGTAPNMTIAENLHIANLRGLPRYPKVSLNYKRKLVYKEEVRMLEMQLEDRLNNEIGSLSGGQRQAITLLMAVIRKPKVLLLDEHTAALDPKSASQVINLTKRFVERDSLTTLMVTHSMKQALELGNRTIMMHRGKIIEDIPENQKRTMDQQDLLDRFSEIRKTELLTEDMLKELRFEYI